MLLERHAAWPKRRARAAWSRKPDSGHVSTISITTAVRRAIWNAMKPRIQCVLTQWKPGFIASVQQASGRRPAADRSS